MCSLPRDISGIFHDVRHVGGVEEEWRAVVDILNVDADGSRVVAHRVPGILRLVSELKCQFPGDIYHKDIEIYRIP
jgi:hypothetical protein